jgi:hypothetical protein
VVRLGVSGLVSAWSSGWSSAATVDQTDIRRSAPRGPRAATPHWRHHAPECCAVATARRPSTSRTRSCTTPSGSTAESSHPTPAGRGRRDVCSERRQGLARGSTGTGARARESRSRGWERFRLHVPGCDGAPLADRSRPRRPAPRSFRPRQCRHPTSRRCRRP